MQFKDIKDQILPLVEKPNRYVSNESNVIRKDHNTVKLSFALCFPDIYEIGMSYVGFKILYHILNQRDDVVAERGYSPWTDLENMLRKYNVPLFSHETYTPLKWFDIVGFTLQYELSYTTILNILDLAQIPVLSKDRNEEDPIIIAGGPSSSNPEPLALFLDAVFIGEGEDAIHEIVDCIISAKEKNRSRQEKLFELAQIKGIYVPAFYEQRADHRVVPIIDGVPEVITRRHVAELRKEDFPTNPLVPNTGIVHERVAVEVMRGCTVGCRFCHAGMFYRPVRERSVEDVLELVRNGLKSTGYDDVSLVSLSSADYTCVADVVMKLNEEHEENLISISLPSLRPDGFTVGLAEEISSVKKSGLTFALEAGTQRLRDVINKPNTEEALYDVVKDVFARGWKTIKLYFMIGLPTETLTDLDGIVNVLNMIYTLGKKHGKGKITINAALSPFIPKPHTPFQWEAVNTIQTFYDKIRYVESKIFQKHIHIKYHAPHSSYLESVLARGDRRVAEVIYRAWQKGCKLDSWDEHFDFEKWQDAFTKTGVDPENYTRAIPYEENLAWDHIDILVTKTFLWREKEKAYQEITTDDCRWGKCHACGVMQGKTCNILAGEHPVMSAEGDNQMRYGRRKQRRPKTTNNVVSKVRIALRRDAEFRFISHLDFIEVINKALRKSELPIVYSQGFSPRPKVAFGPPLPVGMWSEAEYIDIQLENTVSNVDQKLNKALPEGIEVIAVKPILSKTASLSASINIASYDIERMELPSEDVVSDLLLEKEIWVQRTTKSGEKNINIRPYIYTIKLKPELNKIELLLQVGSEGHTRPDEVLKSLVTISDDEILQLKMVRTGLYIRQNDQLLTPLDVI